MHQHFLLIATLLLISFQSINIIVETKKIFSLESMRSRFDRFPDRDFLCLFDGDNIRGKSGFRISKEELLYRVTVWSMSVGIADKAVLFFDHGPSHYAHLLPYNQSIAVVFSGPGKSADDVIVGATKWCQLNEQNVLVVTADAGLKGRCKSLFFPRSENKQIASLDSETFVEMLESMSWPDEPSLKSDENNIAEYLDFLDSPDLSKTKDAINAEVALARKEISLRNQLHNLQNNLDRNKGNKRNRKMKQQRSELQARLGRVKGAARSCNSVGMDNAIITNADSNTNMTAMQLLAAHLTSKSLRERNVDQRVKRIEETWERVVLAERLHFDLQFKANGSQFYSMSAEQQYESNSNSSCHSFFSKQLQDYASFVNCK